MLLITAALLAGCGETPSHPGTSEPAEESQAIAASKGINEASGGGSEPLASAIPQVNADTFAALRRQAAMQGKVLVVDCWATWCPSCIAMFPHLHKAMKERGDGVIMMSLTFDEGEELTKKAEAFLTKRDAWDNAYQAAQDADDKDALVKALSDTWDGGALPAVFVYAPDGSVALEFTETRGEVQDWVDEIAQAVDQALSN
eukprot:g11986.t1